MGKRSKLYKAQLGKFDKATQYQLAEAVKVLKEFPQPKFDQTVELSFKLGVDPKQTDQTVRSSASEGNRQDGEGLCDRRRRHPQKGSA